MMMKCQLEITNCADMTDGQLKSAHALTVAEDQAEFGGTFLDSLGTILGSNSETVQGYCFLYEKMPIGIVLLKRPPSSADWVPARAASLHGLKIDSKWQGRGLGKEAFRLAFETAARRWPEADQLVLAVDAENMAALKVYRNFGMKDSGPIYSGRIGKEHRFFKRFLQLER